MEGTLFSVNKAWLWKVQNEPGSATTADANAASLAPTVEILSIAVQWQGK